MECKVCRCDWFLDRSERTMAAMDHSARHRPLRSLGRFAPGAGFVAAVVGASFALSAVIPSVGPLLWSMAIGALVAPLARRTPNSEAPIYFASRRLLRAGVALLGLQISLSEVASSGIASLMIAAGTVTLTLTLTIYIGHRIQVDHDLCVLIAAGTSICGASAIAAMNAVTGADKDKVTYAVATVSIFGTLAMVSIPLIGSVLELSPTDTGVWAGASIHEVAQVTAAGAAISVAALQIATLVKLARVAMLAPAIMATRALTRDGRLKGRIASSVPGFLIVFLGLMVAGTVLPIPDAVIETARIVSTAMLAAALAGLGLQIDFAAVRNAGLRPLALGFASSIVATSVGLGLVLVLR